MKRAQILLPAGLLCLLFLAGCLDNETPCTKNVSSSELFGVDRAKIQSDTAVINDYLSANGITALVEPNGVQYVISQLGDGATPCLEQILTVRYKGMFLGSGTVFDEATTAVDLPLLNLIVGWKLVLPQIPVGSKVTLFIPSGLAYGPNNVRDRDGNIVIPANSNLIFEVELLAIR